MDGIASEIAASRVGRLRLPFYYGWVNLAVAALAMVATLPGRTHGLGLITEPLLRDLGLDRVLYGWINFAATLLGATFCLPFGRLVDRYGTRPVLTAVAAALGVVVLAMTAVTGAVGLFVAITLTRGLGQGALSLVSQAIVGKWFVRRLQLAMGAYALVLGLGFMIAFGVVGVVATYSWRAAWYGIGLALLAGLAPLGWLLVRNTPEACGLAVEGPSEDDGRMPAGEAAFTVGQALRTPAFWAFALGSALFLLVSSSTSLFGEAILAERGFGRALFVQASVVTALLGLFCNFAGGWLAARWPMGRLMGAALLLLAATLLALPLLRTVAHVYLYAAAMGAAGGVVTVVFFAFWAHAFGRAHLGEVTGVAQALTVLGSGLGQILPALSVEHLGSYVPLFYATAPLAALLGLWAWVVALPGPGCPSGHSGARVQND